MELIALCYERLEPGGTLVIVTPNPADLKVITHYFWMDLTHVRPYPGVLLEEMLQHVGFSIHASHDAIMDSLQSKTGVKKLVGSIVKWIAHRIVGIDVILRETRSSWARSRGGRSRRPSMEPWLRRPGEDVGAGRARHFAQELALHDAVLPERRR